MQGHWYRKHPVLSTFVSFLVVGAVCFVVYTYTAPAPFTKRRRLIWFPLSWERALSPLIFDDASPDPIGAGSLLKDQEVVKAVSDVAFSIINASPEAKDMFKWRVYVIDDDNVINAACMPGGIIVVWTGMLKLMASKVKPGDNRETMRVKVAGIEFEFKDLKISEQRAIKFDRRLLAGVLAHEIGHGIARHTAEQWSIVAPLLLIVSLTGSTGFQIVSEYFFSLPYSRTLETEADLIGLHLLKAAGMDPTDGLKWLEVIKEIDSTPGMFEYVSTHPSNERRAKRMREELEILQEPIKQ